MAIKFAEAATSLAPVQPCAALAYHHDLNLEIAPGLKVMADYMADTLKAQEAFSTERQNVDTRQTKDANLDRVDTLATNLNDATWKRHAKVETAIKYEAAQAEEALAAKTFIKPTVEAAEIRAVFLSKSAAERLDMMRAAFADNDHDAIAAIAHSHKLTHGIDPEALATELDQWKARTAPAEYRALKEYQKALGYHDATGKGLLRWYPKSKQGTVGFAKAEEASAAVLRSYGIELTDD